MQYSIHTFVHCRYISYSSTSQLAFVAIVFRQTNVLWMLFIAGEAFIRTLQQKMNTEQCEFNTPVRLYQELFQVKKKKNFFCKFQFYFYYLLNLNALQLVQHCHVDQ